ncbi:hypothetical protein K501DRAFT_334505 [Backusella circina FSU 941]|nr:hypothetical protein K501DRAFT_334505 [Backusella circina FSU 941]
MAKFFNFLHLQIKAFAQQRRQPQRRNRTYSDDLASIQSDDSSITSLVLLPGQQSPLNTQSDSDWHLINSASPSVQSVQSPLLTQSETESYASYRPSDSESSSDIEGIVSADGPDFSTLPSHDGTGTFRQHSTFTLEAQSPNEDASFQRTIQQLLLDQTSQEEDDDDDDDDDDNEETSIKKEKTKDINLHKKGLWDDSGDEKLNILLPYGGIRPPSFIKKSLTTVHDTPPAFLPTTRGFNIQDVLSGEDSVLDTDSSTKSVDARSTNEKPMAKRQQDLDSIPLHHPGIPGSATPAAILTVIWDSLRRLTNHLLENDANAADTWGTLMSEAVLEGCIPFGSHLHMDIGTGLHTTYNSLLEGTF